MVVLAVLFAGGLFNLQLLFTDSCIKVLTQPYSAYSSAYQAMVVKPRCSIMCLTVITVLVILFIISFAGVFLTIISFSFPTLYTINMGNILLTVYLLFSAFEKSKASDVFLHSLQRIKHVPQMSESLLSKQKQIVELAEGLVINLPKATGKIHLIKECNSYCSQCAYAQLILQELMENNEDISLRMIFTYDPDQENYKLTPNTFLSQFYEGADMEPILSKWYGAKEKNIELFNYSIKQKKITRKGIKRI